MNAKRRALSLLLTILLCVSTAVPAWAEETMEKTSAAPFIDVPADAVYAKAVRWAVERGITNGTSPTTFSPEASCTRGQAVTFLWRLMGSPEPETQANPFTDVRQGSPFRKAILWAYEKGITKGTAANTFSPGIPCSHAHILTFLHRLDTPDFHQTTAGDPMAPVHYLDTYYGELLDWAEQFLPEDFLQGRETFPLLEDCPRSDMVCYLYCLSRHME